MQNLLLKKQIRPILEKRCQFGFKSKVNICIGTQKPFTEYDKIHSFDEKYLINSMANLSTDLIKMYCRLDIQNTEANYLNHVIY